MNLTCTSDGYKATTTWTVTINDMEMITSEINKRTIEQPSETISDILLSLYLIAKGVEHNAEREDT